MSSTNLILTTVLIQTNLLTRQSIVPYAMFVVQRSEFGWSVGVLLVAIGVVQNSTILTKGLARYQRWEDSLIGIGPHLPHNIVMILLVQICYLW